MSEIDCYQHQLVGLIAGVALYHPLQQFDRDGVDDSVLLIGGGSGEHPAAILQPRRCVANYIDHLLGELLETPEHDHTLQMWLEMLGMPDPDTAYETFDTHLSSPLWGTTFEEFNGDYSHWGGDTWAQFIQAAKQPGCWTTPYDPGTHGSIERWIEYALGELVLVCMPQLIDDLIQPESRQLLETIRNVAQQRMLMAAVMTFPTGYETVGGRRQTLGDGNVRH